MEENEIIENEELQEGEDQSEFNSDSSSTENVSDEQIIDAIRSLIDENNIERDSLSDNEVIEESSVESSEIVENESIDYSQVLDDIYYQLVEVNSHLSTLEEEQTATIFEKTLNEYNILDSLIVILVVIVLCKVFIEFIKHFTPKIWK